MPAHRICHLQGYPRCRIWRGSLSPGTLCGRPCQRRAWRSASRRIRHLLQDGRGGCCDPADRSLSCDRDQTADLVGLCEYRVAAGGRPALGVAGGRPTAGKRDSTSPICSRRLRRLAATLCDPSCRQGRISGPIGARRHPDRRAAFSRIDPVIRGLRKADCRRPSTGMLRQLAAARSRPSDASPSGAIAGSVFREAGRSGCVRAGCHSHHVHPQGWISSALLYCPCRREFGRARDSGWLTLGEPDSLLEIDLPPWRKIEPKLGQLVLVPVYDVAWNLPFEMGSG